MPVGNDDFTIKLVIGKTPKKYCVNKSKQTMLHYFALHTKLILNGI